LSNKEFDPNKITVEGLFRAKKEWRQHQANLPFEEKIEIVKQFQTVARTFRASNSEDRDKDPCRESK
jgi:hypothetical protein